MKTLYLCGASGFIGSAVAQAYVSAGWKVIGQSRKPHSQQTGTGITWVSDPSHLEQPADLLINLAGRPLATRWSEKKKSEFLASRVDFTRRLYESFSLRPEFAPKRVFSASAIGWYATGPEARTEQDAAGSGFSSKLCQQWETAARSFETLASQVLCMRLGVVLDASGGALKSMLPAFKMGLGGRLDSGKQMFSWISLTDLLAAIQYCEQLPETAKTLNFTAPVPLSNREFTRLLAEHLHRPACLPVPASLLRIILGEGADEFLLADLNVVPAGLQGLGFEFRHPDLQSFLHSW